VAKSKSKLGLSQRRERAFELFARGYTNAAVAKDLNVHADTVAGYREKYEASIHAQAAANPNFLKEVLQNTIRSLAELDRIREDAWKHLEDRKVRVRRQCPECEHEWREVDYFPVSDQSRAQYHNVLLKAQDQRSKLFGVLGVKQEVLIAILQVKTVQDKVLDWLAEHVQGELREDLATFLESPELAAYMGNARPAFDAIDTEAVEALERAS
jgi:transcriptional regulator NrdR family protein/DNA-binding CsgD family transcriptional regulator